jgi:hypothetical protein
VLLGLSLLAVALGCAADQDSRVDERRVQELEDENAKLRQDLKVLEQRLTALAEKAQAIVYACPIAVPSIDAYVLEVNRDLLLVVLNKGKKDDVKTGYTFSIYKGTQYKGQVRIQDVQDTMSSGVITAEKKPIEKGDSATTNL